VLEGHKSKDLEQTSGAHPSADTHAGEERGRPVSKYSCSKIDCQAQSGPPRVENHWGRRGVHLTGDWTAIVEGVVHKGINTPGALLNPCAHGQLVELTRLSRYPTRSHRGAGIYHTIAKRVGHVPRSDRATQQVQIVGIVRGRLHTTTMTIEVSKDE
jgi:hypothetical protein